MINKLNHRLCDQTHLSNTILQNMKEVLNLTVSLTIIQTQKIDKISKWLIKLSPKIEIFYRADQEIKNLIKGVIKQVDFLPENQNEKIVQEMKEFVLTLSSKLFMNNSTISKLFDALMNEKGFQVIIFITLIFSRL